MKFFLLLLCQIILLDLIDYAVIVFFDLEWIVRLSLLSKFLLRNLLFWEIALYIWIMWGVFGSFQYTFLLYLLRILSGMRHVIAFVYLMFGFLYSFIFKNVAFLSLGKFSLELVEDLVYVIDLGLLSFIYAYNSNVCCWIFLSHSSCLLLSILNSLNSLLI